MSEGLEGVVATETKLSRVDGAAGRLIVAGHDIEELAGHWRLSEVAALLWSTADGQSWNADRVSEGLDLARVYANSLVPRFLSVTEGASPVEALRTGWSLLKDSDPEAENLDVSLLLSGAAPVFLAAHYRHMQGMSLIAPNPDRDHAEDYLAMLGLDHTPVPARAFERYLITVADHGTNASTFTSRVVASTLASEISSVVAALCALKGPLHGGAPGPVLDMFDEIGGMQNIVPWIEHELDGGSRLMGFGHWVYRTRDPRADILKCIVGSLDQSTDRMQFAEALERAVLDALAAKYPNRRLDTNVEYYTALVLDGVGLPRELFTSAFAMGRVFGWCAHIKEQVAGGRLIRPSSRYTGTLPEGAVALQMAG